MHGHMSGVCALCILFEYSKCEKGLNTKFYIISVQASCIALRTEMRIAQRVKLTLCVALQKLGFNFTSFSHYGGGDGDGDDDGASIQQYSSINK